MMAQDGLARNPRRNTAVARTEPVQPDQQYQPQPYQPQYSQPQYSDSGQAVVLTPQPQLFQGRRAVQQPQQQPQQQRADDGYIYPADGSASDQRYPMPRSYRRSPDGQAYYQQQPNDGYGNGYQQPQPGYYQSRGYYQN